MLDHICGELKVSKKKKPPNFVEQFILNKMTPISSSQLNYSLVIFIKQLAPLSVLSYKNSTCRVNFWER